MNSNNGPPSFSSAMKNGTDELGVAHTDTSTQPPSYEAFGHPQGNSQNQFQKGNLYRELDQHTDGMVYNKEAPSFTGMGPDQVNSYNQVTYSDRDVSDQQPPSVGTMGRVGVSQPSGGVDPYSGGQGPNLSGVNQREPSQNGISSGVIYEEPEAHELAGMSLVGKNFRKFYPNAYNMEKDGEN